MPTRPSVVASLAARPWARSRRAFAPPFWPLFGALLLVACGGGGGGSGGAGSTNPGTPPPSTGFSGTVSLHGAALAGVTVVAFNTNTNSTFATTVSDAAGHYGFSGLGTACTAGCIQNFQFFASLPGYAFTPVLSGSAAGSGAAWQWDSTSSTWYAPSGASITRAGYNGQFANPGGGAGVIFTTLNFDSLPGGSVSGGDFLAEDGSSALAPLAASGQTVSYAAGDDAAAHAGVGWPAGRFTDNGDGTVSDHLTGLIWLANAGCLPPSSWAGALAEANRLASGQCGLGDGSTAGQWRMPNLWELESLIDESAAQPALSAGHPFTNLAASYWTSTSYYGGQGGSPTAWAVRLTDGRYLNDGTVNDKSGAVLGAWAVRGGNGGAVRLQATGFYVPYQAGDDGSIRAGVPFGFPRMRDNGNGTVTDTTTGLTWLRQANCLQGDWAGALAAVNALASGQCGLSDGSPAGSWRMPNRKEMLSLADRAQNNQADFLDTSWTSAKAGVPSLGAVLSGFIPFQYYWTSTTDAANPGAAWTVFSCDYGAYDTPKSSTGHTLAVR